MTQTPAADDFAFIAQRQRELAAEEAKLKCAGCANGGWQYDSAAGWAVCAVCQNPKGLPLPNYSG